MVRVVFKNLERSELAKTLAEERMSDTFDRFPDLVGSQVTVTLCMENSPTQAGPDLFGVKVVLQGGRYGGIVLEKSAPSLYTALAEVSEHLLRRLNRFGDRTRVKDRAKARKQSSDNSQQSLVGEET